MTKSDIEQEILYYKKSLLFRTKKDRRVIFAFANMGSSLELAEHKMMKRNDQGTVKSYAQIGLQALAE